MLEGFVRHLETRAGRDDLTCFLLSDHGFSTISERVDPQRRLVEAGLKESLVSDDNVFSASNFYLSDRLARTRVADIVEFLEDEPWVGGMFLREDLLDGFPGAMPQSAVFSGSQMRSAAITVSFSWTDRANEHDVPGSIASDSSNRATHGPAGPHTVNNCFLAWGAGIKQGVVSEVPCCIVDVAPTVLHLLGIAGGGGMDGRVLNEMLADGPHPGDIAVGRDEKAAGRALGARGIRQKVCYSLVEGHRYLDSVRIEPA